jgi:hypothetical protein
MLGAVMVAQGHGGSLAALQPALTALAAECERVLLVGDVESSLLHMSGAEQRPLPRGASELSGLLVALRAAEGDHIALVGTQIRRPSPELLRYMRRVRGSFEVVIPERPDGSLQPLLGLYHPAVLRRAEGLLAAGEGRIAALLELASVRRITTEEVAKFGDPDELLGPSGPQSVI